MWTLCCELSLVLKIQKKRKTSAPLDRNSGGSLLMIKEKNKEKEKTTERKCAWCPIVIILTVRRIYFRRQKVGAEDGGSGWVERERPRGLGQGKGETVGGHRTHVSPPAPPPLSCPHSLYWNFYLKALCHFFHKKFFLFFFLSFIEEDKEGRWHCWRLRNEIRI